MRRIVGLETLEEPLRRSTVTIGKFFAVHRGHQALIRATVAAARQNGGPAVVLTFDRHPLEVLRPGSEFPLLATLEERLDLIEAQGADVTVVVEITPEFLALEAEQFVKEVLIRKLRAAEVLASGNFRFGKGAQGDTALLQQLGSQFGFRYTPVESVLEGGLRISSSRIAACVEAGRVREAGEHLGRPYSIPGRVIRGQQVGRKLGFPTANVSHHPRRLLPANGVYVVRMQLRDDAAPVWPGVCNVGVRPTIGGDQRLVEVHLLDWTGDLYDQDVRVEFLDYLRPERRFPGLDALKEQIHLDAHAAREYFAH